jgi:hypothetical protein
MTQAPASILTVSAAARLNASVGIGSATTTTIITTTITTAFRGGSG